MKDGTAAASADLITPGSVFPTARPVLYASIPAPLLVVTPYVMEPPAGLRDGGLVTFVRSIITNDLAGINSGAAYLSRFLSARPYANILYSRVPLPCSCKNYSPSAPYSLLVPGTL